MEPGLEHLAGSVVTNLSEVAVPRVTNGCFLCTMSEKVSNDFSHFCELHWMIMINGDWLAGNLQRLYNGLKNKKKFI